MAKNWKTYWKHRKWKTNPERQEITEQIIKNESVKGEQLMILDIGCGNGELLRALHEQGHYTEGIDFSQQMVDNANTVDTPVLLADAEDIPKEDETYDVVVANGLIEYLEKDITFLCEAMRVLKSGGILIISYRNELFQEFICGEPYEPERRFHNPYNVTIEGTRKLGTIFFHKHMNYTKELWPDRYLCSGFILYFRKK